MEVTLHNIGHVLALIIEAIALFLIAMGTAEALINMVRLLPTPRVT